MDSKSYNEMKQHLVEVYSQTVKAVKDGHYTAEDGTKVTLDDDREMRQNSKFYSRRFTVNDIPAYDTPTDIEVINTDSISAGKQLADAGYRPAVLNFASRTKAGGGVLNGSRAQEESLFRQTNLFRSLYQFTGIATKYGVEQNSRQYPMDRQFGAVYTPYDTVLRGGVKDDFPFLAHPFKLSFIAVAAVNKPQLTPDKKEIIGKGLELTKSKMRTILRVGLAHGHDSLVLGAFGCGAFHNPPSHIARLFKEIINSPEFKNKYRKIVFAIIENHHSGSDINSEGNLKPFLDVFGQSN